MNQQKRYVLKFGGTSLKGPAEILQSVSIVVSYTKKNGSCVVVCSAQGDTTDHLVRAIDLCKSGNIEEAKKVISEIRYSHELALDEVVGGYTLREETRRWAQQRFDEIDKALLGISLLKDLSPRSLDFVLSFGERLSTYIMDKALASAGVKRKWLTGGEAGIVTDDNYGAAEPIKAATREKIRLNLLPLLKAGFTAVVTGYIAETEDSHEIITLGRGGSDYSATLIGAAIDADEIVLFTDVDGILSADPKVVKDAKIIGQITYLEAMEMSAFGAKAMQPRALEPVAEKGIPVRIKNTFAPEKEGTLILSQKDIVNGYPKNGVKSIGSLSGLAIVGISGQSIVGQPGTAVKIFEILKELEVGILMMSQSVSENNVSLVIKKSSLPKVLRAFRSQLLLENVDSSSSSSKNGTSSKKPKSDEKKRNAYTGDGANLRFHKIEFEDDVSIVAVLGRGMIGTPGIAGRVFSTVAKHGINIRMIAQGSSEINISFVIKEKERSRAVLALHEEFSLGKRNHD
ncbi:MAG TPA: aspartate kinase [Nitrososphaerales archaeon]|nr:aspartate kinase [Nitrososphaerales archaeon]